MYSGLRSQEEPPHERQQKSEPDNTHALPVLKDASSTYQPSKAKLEEDPRVDATFEEAIQALARPMRIRYVPRAKR